MWSKTIGGRRRSRRAGRAVLVMVKWPQSVGEEGAHFTKSTLSGFLWWGIIEQGGWRGGSEEGVEEGRGGGLDQEKLSGRVSVLEDVTSHQSWCQGASPPCPAPHSPSPRPSHSPHCHCEPSQLHQVCVTVTVTSVSARTRRCTSAQPGRRGPTG